MIEVVIDSVRVSLMSQQRIVILKDMVSEQYLPIWIGPCETEAITMKLQDAAVPRPLTHDLLLATIQEMGGRVVHVLISELQNDVFFARVLVEMGERQMEIDSRPSDAIALAVRAEAPIFVSESVLEKAGTVPDEDIEQELERERLAQDEEKDSAVDESRLSAFANFLNTLDLDDLPNDEND